MPAFHKMLVKVSDDKHVAEPDEYARVSELMATSQSPLALLRGAALSAGNIMQVWILSILNVTLVTCSWRVSSIYHLPQLMQGNTYFSQIFKGCPNMEYTCICCDMQECKSHFPNTLQPSITYFLLQAAQAVAASGLLSSKDPLPEAVGRMVLQFASSRSGSASHRQPQVMALMDDIQVLHFHPPEACSF